MIKGQSTLHTGEHLVPVVLDLEKLNQFKDILYEGMVVRCKKPTPTSEKNYAYVDCMARIVRKHPNTVELEDLNPRCKARKIFSLQYKDLVGGYIEYG